jgi:hypothetical protein
MTMQVITDKPGSPEHCGLHLPTNTLPEFVPSRRIPIATNMTITPKKMPIYCHLLPLSAISEKFAQRPDGARDGRNGDRSRGRIVGRGGVIDD